jgi:hypothetical protein
MVTPGKVSYPNQECLIHVSSGEISYQNQECLIHVSSGEILRGWGPGGEFRLPIYDYRSLLQI